MSIYTGACVCVQWGCQSLSQVLASISLKGGSLPGLELTWAEMTGQQTTEIHCLCFLSTASPLHHT